MEKENNNGKTLIDVYDYDGNPLEPIELGTALKLFKTYSAQAKDEKSIQLSREIQDELGFNIQRGWRDDHLTNVQPFSYFPTDKKRDLLLSFDTLREIYRRSSHVRPAIDSIAKEIAHLPIKVEGTNKSKVEDFLENPNISKDTWASFLQKFLIDLLTLDQAIIEKVYSLNGSLKEIWVRDATQFIPIPDHTRTFVNYYEQRITDTAGQVKKRINHNVDHVIWLSQFPRSYSFYGTPIIETIVHEVSTLLFGTKSIARAFVDDEIPPGILWLERIGKQAYERAKAQFESHRGEEGKKKINVVDNVGQVGWIPLTRPFREMQLAELNLIIQDVVMRNFGISQLDIGSAEGLTRATAERLWKTGRSKLFRPLVNLLTIKLNEELIPEIAPNAKIKFVIEPPVDASTAKDLSDAGLITKNEAREALGFDPVKGGDKLAVRVGNQYLVLDDDFQGSSGNNMSQPNPSQQNPDVPIQPQDDDIPDDVKAERALMDIEYKEWAKEYAETYELERSTFDSENLEGKFSVLWREYLQDMELEWDKIERELVRRFEVELKNPPIYKVDPVTAQPVLVKGSKPILNDKILVDIEKRMMVHTNTHMRSAVNLGRAFGKQRLGKDYLGGKDVQAIMNQHLKESSVYWREIFSKDLLGKVDELRSTTTIANLGTQRTAFKELLKLFALKRLRNTAHSLTKATADTSLLTALRGKTDVKWRLTEGCDHCNDCLRISVGGAAGDGVYTIENLPTFPGSADLDCRGNCCCWLDHIKSSERVSQPESFNPFELIEKAPEMFVGARMAKDYFVGARKATSSEIDAVKEVLSRYGDTRVWRLHDQSKNRIGVGVYRRVRKGTNSMFSFDPNTNTIGIQEAYVKALVNRKLNKAAADTIDVAIPHEFVHHVSMQPANRIKTQILGEEILKEFKTGKIPMFTNVWRQALETDKIVEKLTAKELKKILPLRVGTEVAAMVLEKKFATRAELIRYLRGEKTLTGKLSSLNELVVAFQKPTDAQLHRVIDLVEEHFLGRRQVSAPKIPPRAPLKPRKPRTPFAKPIEEKENLFVRAQRQAAEIIDKDREGLGFKEILDPKRAEISLDETQMLKGIMKSTFQKEYGLDQGSKLFRIGDDIISRWMLNSDAVSSSVLKDWAVKKGFSSKVLYHRTFLDDNQNLIDEFKRFVRLGNEEISSIFKAHGITIPSDEAIDIIFSTFHGISKEILKRRYPNGKIKVYRGVTSNFFKSRGTTVGRLRFTGGKMEANMNALSSWTLDPNIAKNFTKEAGGVFEMEVGIDDVFLSFEAVPELLVEKELLLFGKTRTMKLLSEKELESL